MVYVSLAHPVEFEYINSAGTIVPLCGFTDMVWNGPQLFSKVFAKLAGPCLSGFAKFFRLSTAHPRSSKILTVSGFTHAGEPSSDFIIRLKLTLHFTFCVKDPALICCNGGENTQVSFVMFHWNHELQTGMILIQYNQCWNNL